MGITPIMCRLLVLGLLACSESQTASVGGDDQPQDDLTAPGKPAEKIDYREGFALAQEDPDHFEFDEENYFVYSETLHATTATIAIHQATAEMGGPAPDEFAQDMISCFHNAWHVYDGFLYDQFAIKVRPPDDERLWSLSPVGVSLGIEQYRHEMLYEFTCHEMFHAWLGKLIRYVPDGSGNLFQLETWLVEGGATYYGLRLVGAVEGESTYRELMRDRWEDYQEGRGSDLDLSVSDLAALIGPTNDSEDEDVVGMLYGRAAMLNYALDLELNDMGTSLDPLLRALYLDFGIAERSWTEADLPGLLDSVAGDALDKFFASYVETNAELVVDETFPFLEHPE